MDQKTQELLDSQEFYELLQMYRHCPVANQDMVCAFFEDVKDFIAKHFVAREK